ncbi:hypothetical protein ACSBR1_031104 [Camellia fascicularis]
MAVNNTKIGVHDCKIDDDDGEGIFQVQEAQSPIPPGSMASIGPSFFRTRRQGTSDEMIKHVALCSIICTSGTVFQRKNISSSSVMVANTTTTMRRREEKAKEQSEKSMRKVMYLHCWVPN